MTDIFVKQDRKLRLPRRQVIPGQGQVRLQCSSCGGSQFTLHVKPALVRGDAEIQDVICPTCQRFIKADQGRIGSTRAAIIED